MDIETTWGKYLGSVIGTAVGDAVGSPMEHWDAGRFDHICGCDWVDDMYDFREMDYLVSLLQALP